VKQWLAEPKLGGNQPASAKWLLRLRKQSVYAFASLQLRRTRFDLTVSAWLRHA
jgi:hypothetical protein